MKNVFKNIKVGSFNNFFKSEFSNFFVSYFFFFLAVPLSYILRIFYGRVFSVEEYGFFYSVIAFIGLISFISDFGVSESVVYFFSKFRAKKKFKDISKLVFFSYFFIFFTSFFSFFAVFYFKKNIIVDFLKVDYFSYYNVFFIFLFYIFILNFSNLAINFFRALNKTFFYTSFQFFRQLLTLSLLFYFYFILNVKDFFSLSSIWLISYVITTFIYSTILFFYFYKNNFLRLKYAFSFFEKNFLKSFFSYSYIIALTLTVGNLMIYTDQLFIVLLSNVKQNGYYNVIYPTSNFLSLFFLPLSYVLYPLLSRYYHEKNFDKIKFLMNIIYQYGLIFTFPILIFLSFFSKQIIYLLFGEKYSSVYIGVIILNFGFFFYGLALITTNYLAAAGKNNIRLKAVFTVLITNIILDILLIPLLGYLGAAISTSIGFLILFVITNFSVVKEVKISININNLFKILLSNIILFFSVYFFNIFLNKYFLYNTVNNNIIELVIRIIFILTVSIVVYVFTLFYFKIISLEEAKKFLNFFVDKKI